MEYYNTFGESDTRLNTLYKIAFKEAFENVAKEETIANVHDLLNEFKSIDLFADFQ